MMENDNTMLSISRAVTTIKTAILKSQARTLRNANSDVLALYYAVGQYISTESRTQKWGSGAIKTISECNEAYFCIKKRTHFVKEIIKII